MGGRGTPPRQEHRRRDRLACFGGNSHRTWKQAARLAVPSAKARPSRRGGGAANPAQQASALPAATDSGWRRPWRVEQPALVFTSTAKPGERSCCSARFHRCSRSTLDHRLPSSVPNAHRPRRMPVSHGGRRKCASTDPRRGSTGVHHRARRSAPASGPSGRSAKPSIIKPAPDGVATAGEETGQQVQEEQVRWAPSLPGAIIINKRSE